MSKSSHVLKIAKDGKTYTCDLYTTQQEARSLVEPTFPLFRVKIGGVTLYAGTADTKNCDTEREYAPFIIKEEGGIKYCVVQKSFFPIEIVPKPNETIKVTTNQIPSGKTGTGSFSFTSGKEWLPHGTTWTATVAGKTGYNPGALSPGASGTVTANVTVTAGSASLKTYTLKLSNPANETITLKYKNRNAANTGYETEVTKTSTSTVQSFTVRHGTTWTATVAGKTGYNPGALSPGASGTVTANVTVSAGAATRK